MMSRNDLIICLKTVYDIPVLHAELAINLSGKDNAEEIFDWYKKNQEKVKEKLDIREKIFEITKKIVDSRYDEKTRKKNENNLSNRFTFNELKEKKLDSHLQKMSPEKINVILS